ncbi:MAG: hypothetical protein WKF59_06555 [Chitinophagaceae bacterium]
MVNPKPFSGQPILPALAMAAEMSTGILAMMHIYKRSHSISMLITNMEASYIKKATG